MSSHLNFVHSGIRFKIFKYYQTLVSKIHFTIKQNIETLQCLERKTYAIKKLIMESIDLALLIYMFVRHSTLNKNVFLGDYMAISNYLRNIFNSSHEICNLQNTSTFVILIN